MRPSFSISQNADRAQLLQYIRETWKCGSIRPDRSDQTIKYEVRSVTELVNVVLPHFRICPLLSSKQRDVELFVDVCKLIQAGKHLEIDGFEKIEKLAMEMNPSGKRKYSAERILNSLRSDERIVYATGNRGIDKMKFRPARMA